MFRHLGFTCALFPIGNDSHGPTLLYPDTTSADDARKHWRTVTVDCSVWMSNNRSVSYQVANDGANLLRGQAGECIGHRDRYGKNSAGCRDRYRIDIGGAAAVRIHGLSGARIGSVRREHGR